MDRIVGPNYDFKIREDVEEIILGTILIQSHYHDLQGGVEKWIRWDEYLKKHGFFKKEYFRREIHQDIFEAMLTCWSKNMAVDLVTLTENRPAKYRSKTEHNFGLNLEFYAIQLTQKVSSGAHFEFHLFILKQYVLWDYWYVKCSDLLSSVWDHRDVLQVSDNLINGYNLLLDEFTQNIKATNDVSEIKQKARERWEKAQKGEAVGIPTGIEEFDQFASGIQPAELFILAGRPGMGKTTVAMIVAFYIAFKAKLPVIFFSLEMTKLQLMNRIVAMFSGIPYSKIRSYDLTKEEFDIVDKWYDYLENSNLTIIDNMNRLDLIQSKIRSSKCKVALIDYLQLMTLDGTTKRGAGTREQEVSIISKTLKASAKENDIPVIALSQLSRSCEARVNKRPMLSDLRESGSIEQDADMVMFLYRNAYYVKQAGGFVPDVEEGNIEMNLAKGRETGTHMFENHLDFKTNKLSPGFRYGTQENSSQ